jgi:pimeloyl-[acyl-carrier protein] methyl ester esterase
MTLYYDVHGQGPNVVLLHGWGLHGGVWGEVTNALSGHSRVMVPDFPGHGRSREFVPHAYTLEVFAEEVKRILPGPAVWVGWSLGALVTLSAALHFPDSVTKIVLVGATPKFARTADWPYATRSEVLNQFAHDLEHDYIPTLTRFLSLQVSTEDDRAVVRRLREELFRYGEPPAAALRAGLRLLMEADHRSAISAIDVPTLIIHGERDQLVPVGAARFVATQVKQARLEIIPRAGHAPFLTHQSLFVDKLKDFIHG